MKKEYIADCLAEYAKENMVRAHMPGHKGNGDGILRGVYQYDITELSFSDNLANPEGVIMLAERDIAFLCGAKRSRILTGGSTLGVLSLLYAVKNKGKKIIIQRGSHKSVFNVLVLFGFEPIFLNEKMENGLFTGEFLNDELFDISDNSVIGAFLTSPDYFGRALDLKSISQRLKKNNKLLLIDGAHGAHFAFEKKELYAGKYADAWVDGAHKTLSTLTQGAILHVNNEELLEGVNEALGIFSTSSPSYLIMASVESGVKGYLQIKSDKESNFLRARQALIGGAQAFGYGVLSTDDPLKVTLLCDGYGAQIGNALEKAGIYAELVADNAILFMLSYSFSAGDAFKIVKTLKDIDVTVAEKSNCFNQLLPKKAMDYVSARKQNYEKVLLKDANGRVCAENAGLFPPCYPVIIAGEIYSEEVINALSGKNTFGVNNGFVKVVKE